MKKITLIVALAFFSMLNLQADVVGSDLGRALKVLFPSLSENYIDLNHNGRLDRLEDMDELVPESRLKDGVIQIQEVMDFIAANYPFLLIDELEGVQDALKNASGTISELIGLNYQRTMANIIEKKIALGLDGLYLPPSARREAEERMYRLIGTMVTAYKSEQARDEEAFEDARDELFTMIEQGYPIVQNLSDEDENLLVSSLIMTTIKERTSNPVRVKYATKTLGKIKDPFAVSYLIELMEIPAFQKESIDALGAIGNGEAERLLLNLAQSENDEKTSTALYRALGRIGGEESLGLLLEALKAEVPPTEGEKLAILQALSTASQNGSRDRRINPILVEYLGSEKGSERILAAEGLASQPTQANINTLIAALRDEREEEVQIALAEAVNIPGNTKVIDVYTGLLREASSVPLQTALIGAIGDNSEGTRAIAMLQISLDSEDDKVRASAAEALLKLYKVNPTAVAGTLSRIALTAPTERLVTEAGKILAIIADPTTVNALSAMLKSESSDARRSATWALYKIGTGGNVRILTDLNRLITSETEPMEVRINAIRTIGSFGQSTEEINQTLSTVAKMQGEKYVLLRKYAIETMGELGNLSAGTSSLLVRIASLDENLILKNASLEALRRGSRSAGADLESLEQLFNRTSDNEVKTRIIETLGDLASPLAADLAESMDFSLLDKEQKLKTLYALTRCGTEKAYNTVISLSQDEEVKDVAAVLLEEASGELLEPIVSKRLRSEEDVTILAFLEDLQASFEAVF